VLRERTLRRPTHTVVKGPARRLLGGSENVRGGECRREKKKRKKKSLEKKSSNGAESLGWSFKIFNPHTTWNQESLEKGGTSRWGKASSVLSREKKKKKRKLILGERCRGLFDKEFRNQEEVYC